MAMQNATVKCPKCNNTMNTGDEFCGICGAKSPMNVVVMDLNMSFGSMVRFMVKWAIAAIPAAIILSVIAAIFMGIISAFRV